jgi:AraC family transcriptional regulator of adaptative response/methylated-DNA-[protein]-cysteine methyltransferase
VAEAVGAPGGARAVGAACGRNPVSVVVPCHRVLNASGGLGGYAWGLDVKEALLEREGARRR